MSSKMIYFGTRRRMIWVKPFAVSPGYKKTGWSAEQSHLNGGTSLRRSLSAARSYMLTWNPGSRETIRNITDYFDGLYGDDLIYWLDPMAMRQNVLSQNWASPFLGGKDGVPLAGMVRPKLVDNPDMSRGYPSQMAQYSLTPASKSRSFYVPVPAGYTAWVGVHGNASAAKRVKLTPLVGDSPLGAPVFPEILGVGSSIIANTPMVGGEGVGLEISLDHGGVSSTFELAGMVVQIHANSAVRPVTTTTNLATNPSFEAVGAAVTVRENLALNPLIVVGGVGAASNNVTTNPLTRGVTVPAGNPDGLVLGASQRTVDPSSKTLVTIYNIGGEGNIPTPRRQGVWVYIDSAVDGYELTVNGEHIPGRPVPSREWVWIMNDAPITSWSGLAVYNPTTAAGDDVAYITGATVIAGNAPVTRSLFGSKPAAGDFTYDWSGTPNASTSRQQAVSAVGAEAISGSQATAYQSGDDPHHGGKFGRFRLDTPGSIGLRVLDFTPVNGTQYTLLMSVRAATRATKVTARIGGRSDPNLIDLPVGVWVPIVTTQVAGSSASNTGLLLADGGGHQIGDLIDIDDHEVVEGVYTGPYFDGSTSAGSSFTRWDGTPHASTSTQVLYDPVLVSDFISGQGHSGCEVPEYTPSPYSAALPDTAIGMSATLVETGDWK